MRNYPEWLNICMLLHHSRLEQKNLVIDANLRSVMISN